jgi:ABC-2 type transport system ATP-binding protein
MNAVSVRDLTIRFASFTAVDRVSFNVPAGEVFGLLGPNGSGKTTIIKTLCGLIRMATGDCTVSGLDVRRETARVRRVIGYMSQKFGLYEDLNVRENIEFYSGVYGLGGEQYEKRLKNVVDLTSIGPYLERRASQLSGGWKQRLALACAIIHEPRVVFLDEPTAGIDPVARRALWDLIFELSGTGVSFLVTTHYMDEAERCGRVGYLYNSRLIALGTVDELKQLPGVNPPGNARFEILCTRVSEALGRVRGFPYVREATVFGRTIHALAVENSEERLAQDLESHGHPAATVSRIAPSLEDVFVTLTNQITSTTK